MDVIVDRREFDLNKLCSLSQNIKEVDQVRGIAACIVFIVTSGAKHGTSKENLSDELQQLGLPREHASSLCRVYSERLQALETHLTNLPFVGRLHSMERVKRDQTISGGGYSVTRPHITIDFKVENEDGIQSNLVCFTQDDINNIIVELESLKVQAEIFSKVG